MCHQRSLDAQKLQHEFKHASDYGITGNWNNANRSAFEQALRTQISSVQNPIIGTYRTEIQVVYFYDPLTGVDTMVDTSGNFVVGWKLSPAQIQNLLRSGNVQ